MTSSAPVMTEIEMTMTALLVIGSILWLAFLSVELI